MAEQDLDRTEPATAKRITEARNKGQVASSRELSVFVSLLAGLSGLMLLGGQLLGQLREIMASGLTFGAPELSQPTFMLRQLYDISLHTLVAFLPFLALMFALAIIPPVLMHGWIFTWDPLSPKISKLNPLAGLKRIFSLMSLVEMVKAVLKALLIGGATLTALWNERDTILSFSRLPLEAAIQSLAHLVGSVLLFAIAAMLVIVVIDVPYQLWNHHKNLRMTKQEIKDESKEAEGDPQIRGRIRAMQREMARRRMMSNIPKATVIITNPTHYAIALLYTEQMTAPRIVAKGMGVLAERIMELGREHHVPLISAPPFARTLYRHAELEEEIPARLYQAAAQVLAYIYQLRVYENAGGPPPQLPDQLPIPDDLLEPGTVRQR